MFLSFSYKTISPLRNEVHSVHHLVIIFGQENHEDKMKTEKYLHFTNKSLKLNNTEGSEAQNPLFSVIGFLKVRI